jgi:hypothetical protein
VRLAAAVLIALTGIASADPSATGFAWKAPAACPDAEAAKARVEQRLGEPIDHFVVGISVAIDHDRDGYTAHVGSRTLTSATCDDLTDAVAVVVARIATEAPKVPIQVAALDPDRDPARITLELPTTLAPRATPAHWGLGGRISFLSGVGSVPVVGYGGELAASVRRNRMFAELAGEMWSSTSGAISQVAPAGVDVHLRNATLRTGWSAVQPLRAWLAVDAGELRGGGNGLINSHVGAGPWFAIGAGFGVTWAYRPWIRLVGSLEALATLDRNVRFVLGDGFVLYQPAPLTVRCSFGLELAWQ